MLRSRLAIRLRTFFERTSPGLATALLLAAGVLGSAPNPAEGASLSTSVIDHTVCRLDRGTQSAPPATNCDYDAGSERARGIGTSSVSGSGSHAVTTDLDGAVVADLESAPIFKDLRFWFRPSISTRARARSAQGTPTPPASSPASERIC